MDHLGGIHFISHSIELIKQGEWTTIWLYGEGGVMF